MGLAEQLLNWDEEEKQQMTRKKMTWWEYLAVFVLIIPGTILFGIGFLLGNLVEITKNGYHYGANEWLQKD